MRAECRTCLTAESVQWDGFGAELVPCQSFVGIRTAAEARAGIGPAGLASRNGDGWKGALRLGLAIFIFAMINFLVRLLLERPGALGQQADGD